MNHIRLTLAGVMLLLFTAPIASQPLKSPEVEKKVAALIAKMTLEEKVGQLIQYSFDQTPEAEALIRQGRVGSFLNVRGDAERVNALQKIAVEESRLGIPLLIGFDVIHGLRTIFPIPLAQAATWQPALVEQAARVAAREAAAVGIKWTFAPMVDIARDARWGRIAEGAGEDTYLGEVMAAAQVRGFQGEDLSHPEAVLACAKHFVAYGAAEGGRDYNTADMSEKTLREVYLPPFKAAVDAGAGTLMSAFNEISGMPASANHFTLTRILRQEWGFDGFVVSDWNSIGELMNHGIAATPAEAGLKAIAAGVDMDMQGDIYAPHLASLIRNGQLSTDTLDEAVRRILRIKFRLGLFERPYTDTELAQKVIMSDEHVELAREVARQAIVLLKNDDNLLPLKKDIGALAVIGPLADSRYHALGSWHAEGEAQDVVSVLTGIKESMSSATRVLYDSGCTIAGDSTESFDRALDYARQADVAVLVLGESVAMSGEGGSRAMLGLPGRQKELLQAVFATNTPVVLVLMSGRPLAVSWAADNVPAILASWQLGVQHGPAVADVLFGEYNPSGKLPVTFPRTTGQEPLYYNHKNTGRPPQEGDRNTSKYYDIGHAPAYPFGFGLSYTRFEYANLRLSGDKMNRIGSLTASVEITNTGERAGAEVVQLYVRDRAASMTCPVRQLRGFRKVTLQPGETKTVTFTLEAERLGFYDQNMQYIVEPGPFDLWIGGSSVGGLQTTFEVVGT